MMQSRSDFYTGFTVGALVAILFIGALYLCFSIEDPVYHANHLLNSDKWTIDTIISSFSNDTTYKFVQKE